MKVQNCFIMQSTKLFYYLQNTKLSMSYNLLSTIPHKLSMNA